MSKIKLEDKFLLFVVLLIVSGVLYFVSLGFMEETKQIKKENEKANEEIIQKIKEKLEEKKESIPKDKENKEESKENEKIEKEKSKTFEVVAMVEFTEETERPKAEKDFDKLVGLVKTSPSVKDMKILKIKVK